MSARIDGVGRKTAGRQHHTAPCADPRNASVVLDFEPDHARPVAQQLGGGRSCPQRDAAVECGFQQACGERVAHQQPRAPRVDAGGSKPKRSSSFVASRKVGPGRSDAEQGIDVLAADHHAAEHQEFGDRRAQQVELPAKLTAVERGRIDGAASRWTRPSRSD